MLEMKIRAGRRSVAPTDLPSILGAERAYRELGDLVEALIAQMDMLAGDCDLEPDDDDHGVDDVGEPQLPRWMTPRYGADQRRPPINRREIEAEYDRRRGLEPWPAFEQANRAPWQQIP